MGAGEWVGGGIGQEVVEDFGEGGDGFGEGGGGECAGAHGVGAFDEVEEVCAFVACEEDGEAARADLQLVCDVAEGEGRILEEVQEWCVEVLWDQGGRRRVGRGWFGEWGHGAGNVRYACGLSIGFCTVLVIKL